MNPTSAPSVADRVRKRILVAEVSQEQLGLKLGLSQPAISRRVSGDVPWRIDELERLAAVLGILLTELIGPAPFAPPQGDLSSAEAS